MPRYRLNIYGRNRRVIEMTEHELELYSIAEHIKIHHTELTELPELPGDLESLDLQHNKLTQLPELDHCDDLRYIICLYNRLKSLPQLPLALRVLHCGHNYLKSLPQLPLELMKLHCDHNYLKKLPQLPLELMELHCDHNYLKKLPQLPPTLEVLECDYNELEELPKLPEKLFILDCAHNVLETLPILPNNLKNFYGDYNQLEFLDLSSINEQMYIVECRHNKLKTFPKLPNGIENLFLAHNPFMYNATEVKKYKAYIKKNPQCVNDLKVRTSYRTMNAREPLGQSTSTRKQLLQLPRNPPINNMNIIHEKYDYFGRRGTRHRLPRVRPQRTYKYPYEYPQANHRYVNHVVINTEKRLSPPLKTYRGIGLNPVEAKAIHDVRDDVLENDWFDEQQRLGFN
jgi:hypothetical protein